MGRLPLSARPRGLIRHGSLLPPLVVLPDSVSGHTCAQLLEELLLVLARQFRDVLREERKRDIDHVPAANLVESRFFLLTVSGGRGIEFFRELRARMPTDAI